MRLFGSLKYLGITKFNRKQELFHKLICCPDIEEIYVNSVIPNFFNDIDVFDLHLVLPNIRRIEIPSTDITNVALYEMAQLQTKIEHLDISNCLSVTDSGLNFFLEKNPSLKWLNITNTPVLENGVEQIMSSCAQLTYLKATRTFLALEPAQALRQWFLDRKVAFEFIHDLELLPQHEMTQLVRQYHTGESEEENNFEFHVPYQFRNQAVEELHDFPGDAETEYQEYDLLVNETVHSDDFFQENYYNNSEELEADVWRQNSLDEIDTMDNIYYERDTHGEIESLSFEDFPEEMGVNFQIPAPNPEYLANKPMTREEFEHMYQEYLSIKKSQSVDDHDGSNELAARNSFLRIERAEEYLRKLEEGLRYLVQATEN